MKAIENTLNDALAKQLHYQKEVILKEEQQKQKNALASSRFLFFSNAFLKLSKLNWVQKRLMPRRKKRRELLKAFLEWEQRVHLKKKALEREEIEEKNLKKSHLKTTVPYHEIQIYLSKLAEIRRTL